MRVMIGWHFLYEGIVKLLDPGWSSASYLARSQWLLSGLFHGIAENPLVLGIVDWFNIWALILIGTALILGLFTRPACFAGATLLLLYYVANPPFVGSGFGVTEGHYLIVNKTLIELAGLCMLGFFSREMHLGLDRLTPLLASRRKETPDLDPRESPSEAARSVPVEENDLGRGLKAVTSRREILKNLTVVPVFGGFVLTYLKRHGWQSFEEANLNRVDGLSQASIKTVSASTLDDLNAPAPRGRIGDVQISRLITGGNLISGFAHARDLIYVSPLLKSYFHDEKVMETLWLCESSGINTAILRTDDDTIRIMKDYWKNGGKIQWLAQTYPKEDDLFTNISLALDTGAVGAFVMGNIADRFVEAGKVNLIQKSVEFIKRQGGIAGTAAHTIDTVTAVEDAGIDVDFYMKTLHHTNYWSSRRENQTDSVVDNADDNYWEMTPEATIAYMEQVDKPWIAYKVLAAGAITPADGFRYVFENGADFACVGMFDFQVVDNVNTLTGLFSREIERGRPWQV
jgi:uncharacterized membrane protein YphA (DoxX/SURF4 family)